MENLKDIHVYVCSAEALKGVSNIPVGTVVQYSPVGSGIITGITEAGYPQVNHVAVTWLITGSGIVYGKVVPHCDVAKENDMKLVFYYTVMNGNEAILFKQGTGPYDNAIFPDNFDIELYWVIKFEPNMTNVDSEPSDTPTSEEVPADPKSSDSKPTPMDHARELAGIIIDSELLNLNPDDSDKVKRILAAWLDTAAVESRNVMYYQELIDTIGKHIGIEAFIADDGSVSDSVLRAKVPELVKKLVDSAKQKQV